MKKRITAKELNVKIYKSHKLTNNQISVTYAAILGPNIVSVQQTRTFEDAGGPIKSIAKFRGLLNANL